MGATIYDKPHQMLNLVLIVSNEAGDAKALQDILPRAEDGPFQIEWVRNLNAAIARLSAEDEACIDIILLDFFLPDSSGIGTFHKLFSATPAVPIVSLVAQDFVGLAREAVQSGAQGYLLKGYFHSALVPQALSSIIQRKSFEEALFVERERATVTLNSIADAVISTDRLGNVTYINPAGERMTGWFREEAIGRPISDVFRLIDRISHEKTENPIAEVIRDSKPRELSENSVLVRRDGSEYSVEDSTAPIYDRKGKVTGAVIVFRDVGPAQTLMSLKMTYLAQHDSLTNLPNRILLDDRLAHAIMHADRHGTTVALLYLDLDNFKYINDSLGHAMGDQLLKSVAYRLTNCIRSTDTVSRHGGDEFLMLVMEDGRVANAAHIAQKILDSLTAPHQILEHEFHTTASIGISVYPSDGRDAETLIKNADTAMYHAKASGRNNYQFFNADMNRRAVERHSIEAELRQALSTQEFRLYYQPKVNLKSGMITGVEALIRWQHPKRGLILPEHFVSIAEDCGLIVPIGQWVLREACRQNKCWFDAGIKNLSIAVNVSAVELRSRSFLQGLRDVLDETALPPCLLELELTEGILMVNSPTSSLLLESLKGMGVRLAVDDFGTGYSSLSYLEAFPIDVLKIDQSFVHGLENTSGKRVIIAAVIGMGKNLTHRVIAEGIETAEQYAFLNEQQCEEGQGYYFSIPLDAQQCGSLLESGLPRRLFTTCTESLQGCVANAPGAISASAGPPL